MRDKHQSRCYYGLKLAAWLTESSYWSDTMTHRQVEYLINRVLNHPEIYGRWSVEEVDIFFPTRGSTAWARKAGAKKGEISLPPGTRSPLIVLHEMAHLLTPTKREQDHGPGFTAIHLMLVDLFMSAEKARILAASYHATGTPIDPSRIPPNKFASSYVPIIGDANLQETITHLGAMLSSGLLTEEEAEGVRRTLKRLRVKMKKEHVQPLKPMPNTVTIRTTDLLRANNDKQIADLVLSRLRDDLLSERMTRPKLPRQRTGSQKKAASRRKPSAAAGRKVR